MDIQSRADLEWVVENFYDKLMVDDLIGVFFTEVVPIDLKEHIPTIVDFWQSALIGGANYRNNPMEKHIIMSRKKQIIPALTL